jgi:hypothetical protein
MISIVLRDAGYEAASFGVNVYGPIHVRLGDVAFPADDWGDFALPILTWWLEAIATLSARNTRKAQSMRFMDGPFELRAERTDAGMVRISAFGANDELVASTTLPLAMLAEEVRRAARDLLAILARDRIGASETLKLAARLGSG